jgi:Holliday junction resolvase RusA-like endonuclease
MDARTSDHAPVAKCDPDVIVYLPGPPKGKGSGRPFILPANPAKGRFAPRATIFPDKVSGHYEAMLRYAGEKAMTGRPVFDCALRCRVTAMFPVPASKPHRWKENALAGIIRPTVKPDDDNLLKCRDALKGIVFRDDCLFVESVVRKFYWSKPGYMIEIWKLTGRVL